MMNILYINVSQLDFSEFKNHVLGMYYDSCPMVELISDTLIQLELISHPAKYHDLARDIQCDIPFTEDTIKIIKSLSY